MKVTFEDGMQESMLPMFGWEADDDGIARKQNGEPAPAYNTKEPVHVDEIAGFIKHPKTGETMLLRDNFPDIVDYVREDEETGELTKFLR